MARKKRVALIAACVAALALAMLGCACTAAPKDGPVSADDAAAIEFAEGQALYSQGDMLVILDSNPTTGYGWTCSIKGDAVTADMDEFILSDDPDKDQDIQPKAGAGGTHMFGFKAVGTGEASITLTYARPWEASADDKTIVIDAATTDGLFTHVEATES